MRRDIQKVVFERAKANRTWASKTPRVKQIVLSPEGEQLKEESNYVRLKRQKYRNSHFNALERFLVRNVGRPWDKVYAEISASVDARSFPAAEIREYLECLVATKCWREGVKIMTHCHGGPREAHGLYVHPKSGQLMRTPDRPRP
jgi:hypothetical protein